jgi:hypothetical protein
VTLSQTESCVPRHPRHVERSAQMVVGVQATPRVSGSGGHPAVSAYHGEFDTQPSRRAADLGPRPNSPHSEGLVRRPDHDHIAAVRKSFWWLGDVDLLSQRFDARLACMTPRAEGAFVQLFPRHAERFVTALLRAVDALGADPAPEPEADAEVQLRALAARLLSAGMQRTDFVHVGSSLQRAVRESYAEEWTPVLDQAWTSVRDWLVATLQARQAPDPVPAATWAVRRSVADVEFAARLDRLATHAG